MAESIDFEPRRPGSKAEFLDVLTVWICFKKGGRGRDNNMYSVVLRPCLLPHCVQMSNVDIRCSLFFGNLVLLNFEGKKLISNYSHRR